MTARGWWISSRFIGASVLIFAALIISSQALAQFTQQGQKLVTSGTVFQGWSVSLSGDGNTAIVGGAGNVARIWNRHGGAWQAGPSLIASYSVALSADGKTAIMGIGPIDAAGGAVVFALQNGVWKQQGGTLLGADETGNALQGYSVALSADGNTAIIGGPNDNYPPNSGFPAGAAWVFTRTGGVWAQQAGKLVGTGAVGGARQGWSVALSGDGNTAIVGGPWDYYSEKYDIGIGAA
jgi:hypothetical protein